MADIKKAAEWLKKGKEVYRPGHMYDHKLVLEEDNPIFLERDGYLSHDLDTEDLLAEDWEIYVG